MLYKDNKSPFYDPWESLAPGKREQEARKILDEYIEFARKNVAWYRSRLEGYNKNAQHPMANVPVMSASDLRDLVPPVSEKLLVPGVKGYTVFQSGGTTGIPKTTLFSNEELEKLTHMNARGFYAVGLTDKDRVANFWAVGSLYMTFIHMNRMMQQYGCMNFPFSNHTDIDFVRGVAELFKINCFSGISSVVLTNMRNLYDMGAKDLHIDKIYYGGEHFYEADKEEVKRKFGTTIVKAPGYGTVDTWYIGYQCAVSEAHEFHVHDDECFLEIVDPDTGEPCEEGRVGLLLATAIPRRVMPIIRYRVGDLGRWVAEPCKCGRTTRKFVLLGRGDDVLRIGFDSVDYNYIQDVCLKSKLGSGTIQLEKLRLEGKDQLIVRVETEADKGSWDQIAQKLATIIVDNRPTLRKAISNKSVWPIKVELMGLNTLPRNPKTGKLIRVIDAIKDKA
ncbi:MAG: phenylacetate--CoA ligase family protein [Oligoflexales bacterium]